MVKVFEKPLHPGWVYPCTVEEIEQQLLVDWRRGGTLSEQFADDYAVRYLQSLNGGVDVRSATALRQTGMG
jgi:hypothetical protein